MVTLINALLNITYNPSNKIKEVSKYGTKVNIVGDALEEYIKDAFAGTLGKEYDKLTVHKNIFSWQGNQNNPPDLIIKGYDAIEIKKMRGINNLALNSSYPHATLSSSSNMITADCRDCEGSLPWKKDVIYSIGTIVENYIKYLFFVYGDIYAADEETYKRISHKIKDGILDIPDVEFTETNELGKVKKVDPLGITDLRIRGMWTIKHPFSVYSYIEKLKIPKTNQFHIFALMSKLKFSTFKIEDVNKLLKQTNVEKYEIQLKNPNNPSQLIESILIKMTL
jgi:hypothetical protein